MSYTPTKPCMVSLVSHDSNQWDFLIDSLNGFKFWAYIFHDHDIYSSSDFISHPDLSDRFSVGDVKPKHLHIFIIDVPRTFKSWSSRLNFPQNLIQWKNNRKNALLYLTHESPNAVRDGKSKYNRKEVFTSNVVKYEEYINSGNIPDYKKEFNDLLLLRDGSITPFEYLQSHPELLAVTPYQRLSVYRTLLTINKW